MVYLPGDGLRRVKQAVTFKAEVMWVMFDTRGTRFHLGRIRFMPHHVWVDHGWTWESAAAVR
jgi:hypothetical protein